MQMQMPRAAFVLALLLAGCTAAPETSTEPVHDRADAPIGSNIPRKGPRPAPASPGDPSLQSPILR
jgi:hypothetical protein